jgi:hypothetical protein
MAGVPMASLVGCVPHSTPWLVCVPHLTPWLVCVCPTPTLHGCCWCVYLCMKRKIYLNLTVKAFKQGLTKRVNSRCFFRLRLHQLAPHSTTGVSMLTMYSHLLVFSTLWLGYLAGLTHFRRLVFSCVYDN